MNEVEAAQDGLIQAILNSDVYQEYRRQLDRVKQYPDLKAQIEDSFHAYSYGHELVKNTGDNDTFTFRYYADDNGFVGDALPGLPEAPGIELLRSKAMLLLGPDIQMVHDRKAGKVVVRMEVDVDTCDRMQKRFFNLFNQINLCLAINKATLTPVLN